MVIADVELTQRCGNGTRHARIAVPETEHAAIAVAVDEPESGVRIFKPDAFALPHDHLKAHALVVRKLVWGDVFAKNGK